LLTMHMYMYILMHMNMNIYINNRIEPLLRKEASMSGLINQLLSTHYGLNGLGKPTIKDIKDRFKGAVRPSVEQQQDLLAWATANAVTLSYDFQAKIWYDPNDTEPRVVPNGADRTSEAA
jgi:hypothetical protein